MTGEVAASQRLVLARLAARADSWLRESRGGLLVIALVAGAGRCPPGIRRAPRREPAGPGW